MDLKPIWRTDQNYVVHFGFPLTMAFSLEISLFRNQSIETGRQGAPTRYPKRLVLKIAAV